MYDVTVRLNPEEKRLITATHKFLPYNLVFLGFGWRSSSPSISPSFHAGLAFYRDFVGPGRLPLQPKCSPAILLSSLSLPPSHLYQFPKIEAQSSILQPHRPSLPFSRHGSARRTGTAITKVMVNKRPSWQGTTRCRGSSTSPLPNLPCHVPSLVD